MTISKEELEAVVMITMIVTFLLTMLAVSISQMLADYFNRKDAERYEKLFKIQ